MQYNLPVILLRGLVLLPFSELKMEFEADDSRNLIDEALLFHDGNLLVVTAPDPYELNPDIEALPKIGILAKIAKKVDLPNGKVRVFIAGVKRNYINSFVLKGDNMLEAMVSEIDNELLDDIEQTAIIRKVYRELEIYIRKVPYMGNSVIDILSKESDLSKKFKIKFNEKINHKESTQLKQGINILKEHIKSKDQLNDDSSFEGTTKTDREEIKKSKTKRIKKKVNEKERNSKNSESEEKSKINSINLNRRVSGFTFNQKFKRRDSDNDYSQTKTNNSIKINSYREKDNTTRKKHNPIKVTLSKNNLLSCLSKKEIDFLKNTLDEKEKVS